MYNHMFRANAGIFYDSDLTEFIDRDHQLCELMTGYMFTPPPHFPCIETRQKVLVSQLKVTHF